MTKPGEIFIKLKRPCPRCQGVLERYEAAAIAGQPPQMCLPRVRCSACGVEWASVRDAIKEGLEGEGKAPKPERRRPTIADLKNTLAKVKAGVRAGRNVAGSVRAVSEYLASITGRIRTLEKAPDKQEVIAQVGSDVEGIVDQVMLAMEHIEEGRTGKVGPEPPIAQEEPGGDEA